MQSIKPKLLENLQLIYRKSIDADELINRLRSEGKGKFQAIFPKDSGFNQQSKLFKPYVEELGNDISQLGELDTVEDKQALASIVKKMELLLSTLMQFQRSIK